MYRNHYGFGISLRTTVLQILYIKCPKVEDVVSSLVSAPTFSKVDGLLE